MAPRKAEKDNLPAGGYKEHPYFRAVRKKKPLTEAEQAEAGVEEMRERKRHWYFGEQ
jgi:hypothetical protein